MCLSISIRLLLYSTPIFRAEYYYSFYKTFYTQRRDFCEECVMCTTHAWNCKHSRIFRDFFLWAKDDVIFLLLLLSFIKKIVNMIFQIKLPSCFANGSVEYKCYVIQFDQKITLVIQLVTDRSMWILIQLRQLYQRKHYRS